MTPAEFVEASLNIQLCAEIKAYIDKLYLLFINDKHKFIEQINSVTRGSSKTNIVCYLPLIFTTYQKEDEEQKDIINEAYLRANSIDAVRGFAYRNGHIRESEELNMARMMILELIDYIKKKEERK